ncbi:hypothetical protein [Brevundimonas sp.]|uniref:hypothetical protein n=1 Tax=Brevundimonas sp. TaxID=1871086 RepID=UPI003D0D344A
MTEAQIDDLLHELCVDLGFCLHGEAAEQFYENTPADPESFARAVFAADGLDFDSETRDGLKQAVKNRVAKYMRPTEPNP